MSGCPQPRLRGSIQVDCGLIPSNGLTMIGVFFLNFRQVPVVLHLPIINITIQAPDKKSSFGWNTPFYLLLEQNSQDCTGGYTRWPEAYLVTLTDRCSFLCVSGRRGTIAKSMHEEHLCVVALTSMERGTQFFPLASYRLV